MPYKDVEKRKEYQKKYRAEHIKINAEKEKKRQKEYYSKNEDKRKAYSKKWYTENKDHCKIVSKKWAENNKDKQKKYVENYVLQHKEEIVQKNKDRWKNDSVFRNRRKTSLKERRKQRSAWVKEYKAKKGCKICDEKEPVALDFHHRNPSKKEGLVAKLANSAASMKRILAEVEKCDVVCANCHRKIHAGLIEG